MSTEPNTPSDPRPREPAQAAEDLFNFDALAEASPSTAAEMRRELDEALTHVESAKREIVRPASDGAASRRDERRDALREPAASSGPASIPDAARAASGARTAVQHRLQPTPMLTAMLAGVVVVNAVLVAVAWHSIGSVKDVILDLGHEVVDTTTSLRGRMRDEVVAGDMSAAALFGALPEGVRTLELARERIDRGEFARARRTLSSLLAIVDRIEQPARSDVEARAQFLIAESYRAEAVAAEASR